MINANELRLGNWVLHNASWSYRNGKLMADYFQWEDRDWYALGECTLSLEDCSPIPLTAEVLTKCGFRKGEQWYIHQVYYNGKIDINTNRHGIHYGKKTEHGFDAIIELTSLHQLQNLYFALTGKELEYKP